MNPLPHSTATTPQIQNQEPGGGHRSKRRGHEEATQQRMSSLLIPSPWSPSSSSSSSSDPYSSFDLLTLLLICLHLLFSFSAALFALHFTLKTNSSHPLLLRLNSLWPVRLLLVLFASLLSLSELLHLTSLCTAYSLSSQSFAQPAFFATLLFLLRASIHPKTSPFTSALTISLAATVPFLTLHSLFLFLSPWALRHLSLPSDYLSGPPSSRCTHPLYGTLLLAVLGAVYVPMFVSACWDAVTVVINKRLRVRLYALAATVVVAVAAQVTSLATSSLWEPGCAVAQGLGVVSYGAVVVCAAVGEGILVVQPVIDALAIVEPERTEEGEVV